MRYGFVLDQTKCIGCHACTVACKSENDVPLGVFRTWVKHIETGTFPDTKRSFAVLRCNQCEDAPCTTICPTRALWRRPDGIVDFDGGACIGCKSCMQACPYDAIYIDPSEGTAAKCNYCAHRVDVGLAPACEIVCPTKAIVSGDLDDPESPIAAILKAVPVEVRKPEQKTRPKVFYVGAERVLLDPSVERDVSPMHTDPGPLKDRPADVGLTRETYDVAHDAPWGWKVWLYLWTKSVAAGVLLVAALLGLRFPADPSDARIPFVALAAILITTALLIFDLKRPERFWYLLVRPNFDSWLVRGGTILGAYGALCAAWLAAAWMHRPIPDAVHWLAIVLGAATAGYSALLFHQAEGRDFWQSPWLLPHLLAEAVVCGAASILLLGRGTPAVEILLALSVAAQLAIILVDLLRAHPGADVRRAAHEILRRSSARSFWWLVVGAGSIAPLVLLLAGPLMGLPPIVSMLAAVLALGGSLEYGRLWINAGQSVRLS